MTRFQPLQTPYFALLPNASVLDVSRNAQELIQSFWKKKAAHLRANRTGHLARSSSKITRSTDTSSPAKRGYVKKEESSDSDGDEQQRKRRKMKGRASTSTDNNGQLKRESLAVLNKTDEEDAAMADPEVPEDDNAHIASMRDLRHMSEKSWEDVVKTITTVEMAQDELMVFFETCVGQQKYYSFTYDLYLSTQYRWQFSQRTLKDIRKALPPKSKILHTYGLD